MDSIFFYMNNLKGKGNEIQNEILWTQEIRLIRLCRYTNSYKSHEFIESLLEFWFLCFFNNDRENWLSFICVEKSIFLLLCFSLPQSRFPLFLSLSLWSDSVLCVVELEWMLSEVGVLKTELEAPPKQEIRDVMDSALRQSGRGDDDSDEDDWWSS